MRPLELLESLAWKSANSSARSKTSRIARCPCGGFFEYDQKKERLEEVSRELEDPALWNSPERAQELGRERARLTAELEELDRASGAVSEAAELLELAEHENDESTARDIERDTGQIEARVRQLEFKRMFRGEMDAHNAFLDIQAGAGGTEAQDWAQMLCACICAGVRRTASNAS